MVVLCEITQCRLEVWSHLELGIQYFLAENYFHTNIIWGLRMGTENKLKCWEWKKSPVLASFWRRWYGPRTAKQSANERTGPVFLSGHPGSDGHGSQVQGLSEIKSEFKSKLSSSVWSLSSSVAACFPSMQEAVAGEEGALWLRWTEREGLGMKSQIPTLSCTVVMIKNHRQSSS